MTWPFFLRVISSSFEKEEFTLLIGFKWLKEEKKKGSYLHPFKVTWE
jgi:hypothetical protein